MSNDQSTEKDNDKEKEKEKDHKQVPQDDTPAHATEQERERLKDFNKGGIPPGAW